MDENSTCFTYLLHILVSFYKRLIQKFVNTLPCIGRAGWFVALNTQIKQHFRGWVKPLNYIWPTVTLTTSYSNMTKKRLILMFALSSKKGIKKTCLDFKKENVSNPHSKPQWARGSAVLARLWYPCWAAHKSCLGKGLISFLLSCSLVNSRVTSTEHGLNPDLHPAIMEEPHGPRSHQLLEFSWGWQLEGEKLCQRRGLALFYAFLKIAAWGFFPTLHSGQKEPLLRPPVLQKTLPGSLTAANQAVPWKATPTRLAGTSR